MSGRTDSIKGDTGTLDFKMDAEVKRVGARFVAQDFLTSGKIEEARQTMQMYNIDPVALVTNVCSEAVIRCDFDLIDTLAKEFKIKNLGVVAELKCIEILVSGFGRDKDDFTRVKKIEDHWNFSPEKRESIARLAYGQVLQEDPQHAADIAQFWKLGRELERNAAESAFEKMESQGFSKDLAELAKKHDLREEFVQRARLVEYWDAFLGGDTTRAIRLQNANHFTPEALKSSGLERFRKILSHRSGDFYRREDDERAGAILNVLNIDPKSNEVHELVYNLASRLVLVGNLENAAFLTSRYDFSLELTPELKDVVVKAITRSTISRYHDEGSAIPFVIRIFGTVALSADKEIASLMGDKIRDAVMKDFDVSGSGVAKAFLREKDLKAAASAQFEHELNSSYGVAWHTVEFAQKHGLGEAAVLRAKFVYALSFAANGELVLGEEKRYYDDRERKLVSLPEDLQKTVVLRCIQHEFMKTSGPYQLSKFAAHHGITSADLKLAIRNTLFEAIHMKPQEELPTLDQIREAIAAMPDTMPHDTVNLGINLQKAIEMYTLYNNSEKFSEILRR